MNLNRKKRRRYRALEEIEQRLATRGDAEAQRRAEKVRQEKTELSALAASNDDDDDEAVLLLLI